MPEAAKTAKRARKPAAAKTPAAAPARSGAVAKTARTARKPAAAPAPALAAADRNEGERRVLHVGCGGQTKAGMPAPFRTDAWREIRLDINPAVKPDILASLTDLSMIEDGAVDAVYSSHNIEHLFAHEVPLALREFARVLHPDRGFLVITCPDLQALGERIAEGRILEPLYTSPAGPIAPLDILYGHRAAVARGETYMAHRIGFTARMLVDTIRACGFSASVGARRPAAFALWAVGFRWAASEVELARFRDQFFPKG